MSKKGTIPDAWDDDWEAIADKQDNVQDEASKVEAKLTRAELKARHAEINKQLWQSAESPERPLFLNVKNDPPINSDFKPTVKVLSRKPPPKIASRSDAVTGMASMSLQDDDDSEEEERKKNEQSFVERQARAQREREEKQRKYLEVRERLFGSGGPTSEEAQARAPSGSRNSSRGKGRGRTERDSQPTSSADQSPARGNNPKRQLYDPGYSVKPNSVFIQKKENLSDPSRPETPSEDQPVRAPRGPDGSGRGGFGFAPRGNKLGAGSNTL